MLCFLLNSENCVVINGEIPISKLCFESIYNGVIPVKIKFCVNKNKNSDKTTKFSNEFKLHEWIWMFLNGMYYTYTDLVRVLTWFTCKSRATLIWPNWNKVWCTSHLRYFRTDLVWKFFIWSESSLLWNWRLFHGQIFLRPLYDFLCLIFYYGYFSVINTVINPVGILDGQIWEIFLLKLMGVFAYMQIFLIPNWWYDTAAQQQ